MPKRDAARVGVCPVASGLLWHSLPMPPPTRNVPTAGALGRSFGGKLIADARIGAGALGVVYRAKHVHLPSPVAVKVLHETLETHAMFRSRFFAEARAASTLDHPNLVRVLDFGEEADGTLWLAMELLDGMTLQERLAREGRLSVPRAAEIVMEICAGLAHAHARSVIHGDVKPSNVVLVRRADDDGEEVERAKLCDFGVARAPHRAGASVESGVHPAIGTPAYMSPEQCLGEGLDERSDVYACGILFYELVTGLRPFVGDDQEVLRQQLLLPPELPSTKQSDIDPRVDAIIQKALAKQPDERFAKIRELRASLRELLPVVRHDSASPPPMGPARSRFASEVRERPAGDDPEQLALAELLANGTVDAVAAKVARLPITAEPALLLLEEAERLVPVAEQLLAEDVLPTPYIERLLQRAGRACAQALWLARKHKASTKERRERFVVWLAAIGPAARDVLLSALAELAPHGRTGDEAELIEDVLLSLPRRYDEDFAAAVVGLVGSPVPRVRELALAVFTRRR